MPRSCGSRPHGGVRPAHKVKLPAAAVNFGHSRSAGHSSGHLLAPAQAPAVLQLPPPRVKAAGVSALDIRGPTPLSPAPLVTDGFDCSAGSHRPRRKGDRLSTNDPVSSGRARRCGRRLHGAGPEGKRARADLREKTPFEITPVVLYLTRLP
jgi:hypothetical protein